MFGSGPLDFGKTSDGMTILRVDSEAEARDDRVKRSVRPKRRASFTVREWMVMEGSFSMKVNFSDRSVEIS